MHRDYGEWTHLAAGTREAEKGVTTGQLGTKKGGPTLTTRFIPSVKNMDVS